LVERESRKKPKSQGFGYGHLMELSKQICNTTRNAQMDEYSKEFCQYMGIVAGTYHVGNLEEMAVLADKLDLNYELRVDNYRGSSTAKIMVGNEGQEPQIARTPARALAAAILIEAARKL
jgi:hypothetical protein